MVGRRPGAGRGRTAARYLDGMGGALRERSRLRPGLGFEFYVGRIASVEENLSGAASAAGGIDRAMYLHHCLDGLERESAGVRNAGSVENDGGFPRSILTDVYRELMS